MEQRDLLAQLVGVLERMGSPYMLVGGYASAAWGEPRFTPDIDVVVSLTEDEVTHLTTAFPFPEYHVSPEAVSSAIRLGGQFNVIHPASGNKVDFFTPAESIRFRTELSRRKQVRLNSGANAYVAAPEDIIIKKMECYREGGSEKHLRDITGILKVSGEEVDRAYVAEWAQRLGLTEIWRAILRRVGEGDPSEAEKQP